jgi:hypothetical protein
MTSSIRYTVALAVWMSGTTTLAVPPLRLMLSPSTSIGRVAPVKVSSESMPARSSELSCSPGMTW